MAGRISTLTLYDGIAQSIARSSQRMLKLQQGMGDGREVRAPSDDPVRAQQAMWYREQIRSNAQYQRNLDQILSNLSASESALSQIQDQFSQIRSLQTSGSDDSMGADGRAALAAQVDQLTQVLAETGNSRYAGAYLFGGRNTLDPPIVIQKDASGRVEKIGFNPSGVGGDLVRMAAPEVSLTINVTASDVFGKDADLFGILGELREALAANDGDRIRGLAGRLDAAQDTIANAVTTIGSLTERAQTLKTRVEQDGISYEKGRSDAEDLDVARATVDFQAEQAALQAALASGSRILNLSLLDYLT
jgi:flagellar hook-associated protein 3 FlgL